MRYRPDVHRLPQFADGWAAPDPRAVSLLRSPEAAHFRSVESSPNSDQATAQTIRIMCRHIEDGAKDPLVQRAAADAPARFRGGPVPSSNREVNAACSDWWWVRHALRFVHHETLIRQWLAEADQLQLLIPPEVVLRMRTPEGDCAVYTMLVCALLRCQGIRYELVTVAASPAEPDVFSHVYCRAVIGGARLALDASHGDGPGWQVPSSHVTRKQVWNEHGEPIADEDARYSGLHAYRRSVLRGRSGLRGFRRGLGDCGSCIGGVDAEAGLPCSCPGDVSVGGCGGAGFNCPPGTTCAGGSCVPSGSGGGSGFNWDSTISNLLNQWTKIGGQVIAPQTTLVRGANGQLMYSSPAASGSALPATLLGSSALGGSSLLLIGAALLAGIMVVKAISK